MRKTLLCAACLALSALPALADDWPQWRGPNRDGVSKEAGLLRDWPGGGPKLLWAARNVGGGYSTPSVARGRIYLLGSSGNDEFLVALDEQDGRQVWSTRIGAVGPNKVQQWPGPRSTPTVDGDRVYVLGSDGDLGCLDASKGRFVWGKNLRSEFGGTPGNWAYAESPLVDGDLVVCTPGGERATIVALNKADGKEVWRCPVPGGDRAAYASAVVGEAAGRKQYIQFLASGVVGVDAKTGKYLWRYSQSANRVANIPTPVFHEGYVWSASGYNAGGGLVKLQATGGGVKPEPVYFLKEFKNQIGGTVLVGGHLYGHGGQGLLCVDLRSGKVKWREASIGRASVCYADNRLYVREDDGPVRLVEATPSGYRERGRFRQPERSAKPAWPYPVVANGRLYLRDMGVLLCYDVKAPGR
jgi:outer membrane protein assembly factor BamB